MGYIRDRWKDPARRGKGKRWQVKYQVDGRERDGGTYDVKQVARRRLTELESSLQRGEWVDTTDRTTVAEYARRWAGTRPHGRNTMLRIDDQIRTHLENHHSLGARRLVAVRPADVQEWASELAQTHAPSTVQMLVGMLGSIYRMAVRDRRVPSSPVVQIAMPPDEKPQIVPLTVAQVGQLADAVPARNRAMILMQAGVGLRMGELLALRAEDVNFLGRTVRTEWQLEKGTRKRVRPKSPRSRRTIPLPQVVADALAAHMATWPPLADGTLFYGTNRRPYHHPYYGTRVFKAAVDKLAAVEGSTFPVDTATHAMRHHYASVLLAAGESVIAVADRMGHVNAGMVIKIYGHLMPDSEDKTRRAVDAAWSAAADSDAARPFPTAQ